MKTVELNGMWQMSEVGKNDWHQVTVPGSVLSGLLENGRIEDPYYGTNEREVCKVLEREYEFKYNFDITTMLQEEKIDLVCYGIDTIATVMLNGICIGKMNNMHRTWRIPCKKYLKKGKNEILIRFNSPIKYVNEYKAECGKEISFVSSGVMPGSQYLRKAHSMFGWDWGAKLPDMGIWRKIELCGYSHMIMDEVQFEQIHSHDLVELKIKVPYQHSEGVSDELTTEIVIEREKFKIERNVIVKDGQASCNIRIEHPQLWWPNGYGNQPLYKVTIASISLRFGKVEEKEYWIGLRTITVSQERDEWGNEFAFCVNGVKIYTMGANYIPEDCIYSRITENKIRNLVESAKRANYNCLRVWGGGYYPSDIFYHYCDEMGIIVWQDLMYACNIYEFNEEFEQNIIQETYDNVKRVCHHACLGLWCGNNEIESAWENWSDFKKHSKKLKADYIKQFEYVLPRAVKEVDATTFYWPSSPSSGGCFDDPDSPDRGDVHYWEVWHGQVPFSEFQKQNVRFCSEFGFQSFPSIKTIQTFAEPKDYNMFSEVMESHQKNDAANGKILYYISEHFLYPKDFQSMVYISQVLQGLAIKCGVEHWRRIRGRNMGTLYWQINDNWPVVSWSSIDYYGRWKALHYMAKRFYRQKAGSILYEKGSVRIFASNESLEESKVKVTLKLKDMKLQELERYVVEQNVHSQSVIEVISMEYKEKVKGKEKEVFLEVSFEFDGEEQQVETLVFEKYKYLKLQKPEYQVQIEEQKGEWLLTIQTGVFAPFVEIDFVTFDGILSDNFFDCTSTSGRQVSLNKKDILDKKGKMKQQIQKEIIVKSLYDSFYPDGEGSTS